MTTEEKLAAVRIACAEAGITATSPAVLDNDEAEIARQERWS